MTAKRFLWLMLGLLSTLSLMVTACAPLVSQSVQAAEPPEKVPMPPRAATSVQVAKVTRADISIVYSYAGTLHAKQTVSIVPVASGRVQSVLVAAGDRLKAGDPIAVVDSRMYAAQVKQAEANLELARLGLVKMREGTRPEQIAAAAAAVQFARNAVNDLTTITDDERTAAVAALAQAEMAVQAAQAEYDKISWAGQVGMTRQALELQRATTTYQAAQAAYNLQTNPSDVQLAPLMIQLAQAEMALALAKQPFTQTDFDQAEQRVKLAEAALELAKVQLEETTVRAPFDGMVAELYINEGSMVGPQVPVALYVSSELEALINVEESRITEIRPGQNAALRVAAYPGQDFPGLITSVAPVADKDSHTFLVKVSPVDHENRLRAGMYANLSILVQEKQAAVLAPRAALVTSNTQPTVYVVQPDGTVRQRQVVTGLQEGERVEILSGLQPGDQVVVAGQNALTDGAPVQVVNTL